MFFAMFFIAIVAAPSVIISIDEKVDISLFFGENEEEENLKLLFDISSEESKSHFSIKYNKSLDFYTFKNYKRPSINFVSPPPELV